MNSISQLRSTGMLLKITETAAPGVLAAMRQQVGTDATLERLAPTLQWYVLEACSIEGLSPGGAFERAHALLATPDLLAIEVEFEPDTPSLVEPISDRDPDDPTRVTALAEPESEKEGQFAWHIDQVKAGDARMAFGVSGSGVRVAHPDTGYTLHPELVIGTAIRADLGYNFKERKSSPIEPLRDFGSGHGTSTASVLVGAEGKQHNFPDDISFVEGVAPGAELVPMRVDDNVFWIFSAKNDVQAIELAIDRGCHVISMSRSGPDRRSLRNAVSRAIERGLIIVAAAGNGLPSYNIFSPANYEGVVCAAGSTHARRPWGRSSRGPEVTLGAPAHDVYRAHTQKKSSDYSYTVAPSSGTSYATPIIAGAAALWLEKHGGTEAIARKVGGLARVSVVFKHLLRTAGFEPGTDWDTAKFGPGILDCVNLLSAPLPSADRMSVLESEAWVRQSRSPRTAIQRRFAVSGIDGRAASLMTLELETAQFLNPLPSLLRNGSDSSKSGDVRSMWENTDISSQLKAFIRQGDS